MKTVFRNKRIAGILTVLPESEIFFEDEVGNYSFPEKQTMRLKKVMGYEKHRIAKESTTTSDLAIFGMKHLLRSGFLNPDEVGGLIVATITPDHFIPHVSNIVQGECDLPVDALCIDIPQGCCGFLVGLIQGFMMLDYLEKGKKVVLINSDVLSHKVSKHDRKSYPLIGDAATITVLEYTPVSAEIHANLKMDGKQRDIVTIPAGGCRLPCSAETAVMYTDDDGNRRSQDNLCMDGNRVFSFVQTDVPPLVEETLEFAGWNKDQIDWFLCHQPNRFVLRKLAESLKIPYEKMPMNIVENYGNASGATIPMAITCNLSDVLKTAMQQCCLISFGSGMAWGAITMELGNLSFCETIQSNL